MAKAKEPSIVKRLYDIIIRDIIIPTHAKVIYDEKTDKIIISLQPEDGNNQKINNETLNQKTT